MVQTTKLSTTLWRLDCGVWKAKTTWGQRSLHTNSGNNVKSHSNDGWNALWMLISSGGENVLHKITTALNVQVLRTRWTSSLWAVKLSWQHSCISIFYSTTSYYQRCLDWYMSSVNEETYISLEWRITFKTSTKHFTGLDVFHIKLYCFIPDIRSSFGHGYRGFLGFLHNDFE